MSPVGRHRARPVLRCLVLAWAVTGAVVGAWTGPAFSAPLQSQATGRVEAAATIPPSDTMVPTVVAGSGSEPTGAWLCPVAGAKFTNDWGQPRSGGRRHEGTDMLAPRGTPIVAPVSGVVKRSSSPTGGLTFNLRATDGFTYVGMHLSAHGAEGAVRAGDIVGYVGDTGNARGTDHLHFEIQVSRAVKLNPFSTLKRYC